MSLALWKMIAEKFGKNISENKYFASLES